jgi:dipeptidyl aminopeptidase/acylaminoacyl peptidase
MLRLAGLRIDQKTNGPHSPPRVIALTLRSLDGAFQRRLDLPANPRVGSLTWSPDGSRFAFTHTADDRIELWVGTAIDGAVKRLDSVRLNGVMGDPYDWLGDNRTILCKALPADRPASPVAPITPAGPLIQESFGKAAPVRTYQDLLASPHDENLFDHLASSQITAVDVDSGVATPIGQPAVISMVEPSPDGRYLLVSTLRRPYSYWHPVGSFPRLVQVWSRQGQVVHTLADLPLADQVPIEGVPTGPRGYHWRPNAPATLVWVEALDGGDPRKKADFRDHVHTLAAPFDSPQQSLTRTRHRFSGIQWSDGDGLTLVSHYDRDRKWSQTELVDAEQPTTRPRVVWDLSVQDRYKDPGEPLLRRLPTGGSAMWRDGSAVFLSGAGASPEGDRPFLDRLDLNTGRSTRLFHCEPGVYEYVVALLDDAGTQFITRRESASEPPNYWLRGADGRKSAITRHDDPTPELRRVHKRLVTYRRDDGVQLSFTLYLPPDYKEGERRPTVVWAYPREYAGADTAGQVSGSPHRFTTIVGPSHLFFLLAGYVILDGATIPVVGPPETANDTYVRQIVASAQAAIDKAVELGVTDPKRVGVGGHSYGAFMTANLLAHSDLFQAGIARSGAYNRTLTPFGFQSERRTLWEAPDIYRAMSPFMHADKLKEPILLIHGAVDDNSGTFPMQSERFYQALRGNAGNVRLVMLPDESHGYAARESIEHTLWEMVRWFDLHVKDRQPHGNSTAGETPGVRRE